MFVQGMVKRKKAALCMVVGKPKAGREGLSDGMRRQPKRSCSERSGLIPYNGRTIQWFGLERTLKLLFKPSCHGLGHLPQDEIAPSPIQPELERFQGWESLNTAVGQ